ncbi:cation diffusion facilitator family transporter [Nibribacter ruber]|uniref:Cation diffusion facilitator family transporter n=1 Tax=Nibribacter ruber TaxID=2698458 RepID=A0A6P1P0P7_9BACT|nr:cation diffusion facilitator family transporter [Nibribacter ruber]QHL86963.1 cation diffusion facilitator family transporter [Nibribacter ruber]
MQPLNSFEYPEELKPAFEKAKRLEWITIFYLISAAALMFFTMGNSQAMKTAWFEDALSLTPSISFLIASRVFHKKPNKDFPYGYHRVVSIAYLCSSLALFAVGAFLIIDSSMTLIKQEHPTIGIAVIFGHEIWLGYVMMAALVYGSVPPVILGHMKLPLAKQLHEKNLFTDAEMNKADWMTGLAAILGIAGIGLGFWWADAVAALIISLDIIKDGFTNLKQAVFDLMDEQPKTVEEQKKDPLLDKIDALLKKQDWVKEHVFRMREEGHVYLGEAYVVPTSDEDLVENLNQLGEEVEDLSWRIEEFVIMPVREIPETTGEK